MHALAATGTFRSDGSFEPILLMQENVLRELFEAEVFKLLVKKGLISRELIGKMRPPWRTAFGFPGLRRSGPHRYSGCGPRGLVYRTAFGIGGQTATGR